ncbi:MAG: GTP cyclohydrolase II [Saprospiraceae bacterium]|nr:GTP cyclohydrolase II [Saprospiraceae bacterium]
MKAVSRAMIPTPWGVFEMVAYASSDGERMPHLALVHEKFSSDNTLVRIHSECLTGDLFESSRCECGDQLRSSLEQIGHEGGLIIYLRQEGRGIGLIDKLKAYQLQDIGYDTVDANVQLGHAPDERSYDLAVQILKDLKVKSIRLLTNNPDKIKAIEESEITLMERVPLIIKTTEENLRYMETKKKIMGHLLD